MRPGRAPRQRVGRNNVLHARRLNGELHERASRRLDQYIALEDAG